MADETEMNKKAAEAQGDLDALLQKIFEERGYDFRDYKKASIDRRISKRLYDNHLQTYEQYMQFLDKHPEEYAKLFDTLLINVTEFFRDPEAWEALSADVIPKILSRKDKGDSIRVWSAGCSSGEEAYSIAMMLSDKLGDRIGDYEIRIYATDIDEAALNDARRGIYPANKMKNLAPEQIENYFVKEDDSYKVKRNIRQMVAFGRQDLITDAPISHLDLIICRNVLIYFKLELQSRIVVKFHYALNKNGFIFFGKSESMLTGSKLFLPVNKKWRIFEKAAGAIPSMAPSERRATFLEESMIDQAVREARQEFRALEFYNQSILQNISLGIVVVSNDNTIVTWNTGAEALWGISSDSTVGRSFFDIGMGDRLPGIREQIEYTLSEGKTRKLAEVQSTDQKGNRIFVDVTLVPLITQAREKLGVIIIASDVTEKKKISDELQKSNEDLQTVNEKLETTNAELEASNEELETTTEELQSTAEELETSNEELQSTNEELETSNEELRSINEELETTNDELKERTEQLNSIIAYNQSVIQGMRESLIAVDRNENITIWNPASVKMWGVTAGNAIGRNVSTLLPELGLAAEDIMTRVKQANTTGSSHHEDCMKYMGTGGMVRFFEFDIVPIIGAGGEATGAMLMFRDITDEVKTNQNLTRKTKIITAIYNLSTLVSQPISMNRTLEEGLNVALKATGADAGAIYLTASPKPELMMTYSANLPRSLAEAQSRVKIGEGFTGTTAKNGEIYFINSIQADRRRMTDISREGIVAIIGIPLRFRDEIIGVLELYSKKANAFSAGEMELYAGIGEQLAVAVRIAKAPLSEFGRILSSSSSLGDVARAILGLIGNEFDALALWMYVYDEQEKRLKVVAQHGFPAGTVDDISVAPGEGIAGEVFHAREPKMLKDASSRAAALKEAEIDGFREETLIAMPLTVGDRTVGVLCMYVKGQKKAVADKEYVNLLMIFADQIALAIDSALHLQFVKNPQG